MPQIHKNIPKRGKVPLARKKRARRQIGGKSTRTQLIKEADRLASLYVRQKYANEDGIVKCFTCEYSAPIKKMQNGHWIVRQYKYTRWHEDNMRPQDYSCNFRMNGRPHVFRENLVKEIGLERVETIERLAKPLFKEKDEWIMERIDHFTALLESL